MDKLFFKLFLVILLSLSALYVSIPWSSYGIEAPFSGKEYKLGLDLQGGVELDYKVDLTEVQKEEGYSQTRENSIIEGLKSIVDKRIEALNINDSVITTANYGGEKHIIVQIPLKGTNKAENELNIKRAKEAIGRVMKIEFKELRTEITPEDLDARKQIAQDLLSGSLSSKYDFNVTRNMFKDSYENVTIGTLTGTLKELSEKYFSLSEEKVATGYYSEVISGTGMENFSFINGEVQPVAEQGYWVLYIRDIKNDVLDFDYAFISAKPSEWKPAADSQGRILNDKYFLNSSVQTNQAFQPMVELTFNDEGAKIFGELTTRLKGKQIAIFVGGDLLTAPNVNEPILTGKAVITGSYTLAEASKLSQDINTGVVPAPIYLTSERSIDSKLGLNSLDQLIVAGMYGFVLIFLFLIIVYRASGFAAGLSLLIYTVLILAGVKIVGVTLTLASIAGLILSIGMAIDSNILIFARIKEELQQGHKIELAIKNGFDRSWSAIWDTHLTGFITAIILFVFGVNMIKGFGLMLGLGLLVSFFTTMVVSKLFIRLIMKKRNISLECFLGMKSTK